jgi:hypothetical protein
MHPSRVDGRTLVVTLPAGTSQLGVSQPCRRRTARIRIKAPRGHRVRSARIFVNGKRVRSVRGRAARRAIRIKLPAGRARVVVRAMTDKGRKLVRRKTYRACS